MMNCIITTFTIKFIHTTIEERHTIAGFLLTCEKINLFYHKLEVL